LYTNRLLPSKSTSSKSSKFAKVSTVLVGAGIALGAAAMTATPANADPSVFGVLSCSCEGVAPAAGNNAIHRDQIDEGIQSGLASLGGTSRS
jgi:hypothetical protein